MMMNKEDYANDDAFPANQVVHVLDKWNASKLATRDTNSFNDYVELTEAENEIARIFNNQASEDGLNKSLIYFLMEKDFKEKHNEEHEYFTERKVLVEKIQKWLDRSPLFKLNLTSKRWECYYGDGEDAKILWDKVLKLRFAWSLQDSSKNVDNLQQRLKSFKEVIRIANPGSTVGQLSQKLCSKIIMPYSLELLAECERLIKTIEYEPQQEDKFTCSEEGSLSTKHNQNQLEQNECGDEQVTKHTNTGIHNKAECSKSESEEKTTLFENESLELESVLESSIKAKKCVTKENNEILSEKKSGRESVVLIIKKIPSIANQSSNEYRVDEKRSNSDLTTCDKTDDEPKISSPIPDKTDDDSSVDEDIFGSSVTKALIKSAAMTSEFEEPLSPHVSSNTESSSSGKFDPTTSVGSSVISAIVIPDDKQNLITSADECLHISQTSSTSEIAKTKSSTPLSPKLSPSLSPKLSSTELPESLCYSSSETLTAPSSPQNELQYCAASNTIAKQKQDLIESVTPVVLTSSMMTPVVLTSSMMSLLKFTLGFDHFPSSASMIKLAKIMITPLDQVKDWFFLKRIEKRENGYHLQNKFLKYCPYCDNHWPFSSKELGQQHIYEEEHIKNVLQTEQENCTFTSSSLNSNPDTSDKKEIHRNKTEVVNPTSNGKCEEIGEAEENAALETKVICDENDSQNNRQPMYGPWNMASIIDLAQTTISGMSSNESHVICPLCFLWIHAKNLQRHLIDTHLKLNKTSNPQKNLTLNKVSHPQKNIANNKKVSKKLAWSSTTAKKVIQKKACHNIPATIENESGKDKLTTTIDNDVMNALGFTSVGNESEVDKINTTIDNVIMKTLGFSSVNELPSTSQEKETFSGPSLDDSSRNNSSQVEWTPKMISPPLSKKKKRNHRINKEFPTPEELALLLKPLQQGWNREVVYRGTVTNDVHKKWDVYYRPPVGKKLRSNVEVGKFLIQNAITDLTVENFNFGYKGLGDNVPNETILQAKPSGKRNASLKEDELSYLLSTPSASTATKSSFVSESPGWTSTDPIKKSKNTKKNVTVATTPTSTTPALAEARAAILAQALEAAKTSDNTMVVPFNDLETDMDCADDIGIENETGEMTGFETWHTPSLDKQNDQEQMLPPEISQDSGISPALRNEENDCNNILSISSYSNIKQNIDTTPIVRQGLSDHDYISSPITDPPPQISLKSTAPDRPKIRIKSMLDLQDNSEKVSDIGDKPLALKPLSSIFKFDNKNNMPTVSSVQTVAAKENSDGIKKFAVLTGLGSPPIPEGNDNSPIRVISTSMNNEKKSPSKTCSHLNLEDIPFEEEVIDDSDKSLNNVTGDHETESSNYSCSLSQHDMGKRKRSEEDFPANKREKISEDISQTLTGENSSFTNKIDKASTIGQTPITDHDSISQTSCYGKITSNSLELDEDSEMMETPSNDIGNNMTDNVEILSNNDNTKNDNYNIVDLSDSENEDDNEDDNDNIVELTDSENEDDGFMPLICAVRGGKEVEEEFHQDFDNDPSSTLNTSDNTFLQQVAGNTNTIQTDPSPMVLRIANDKSYPGKQVGNSTLFLKEGQQVSSSFQIPLSVVSQSRPVFTTASTTNSEMSNTTVSYVVPSSQQSNSGLQVPLSSGMITLLQKSIGTTPVVVTNTFKPMVSIPNVSPSEKITKTISVLPKILSNTLSAQGSSANSPSYNPVITIHEQQPQLVTQFKTVNSLQGSNISCNVVSSLQERTIITPTFKPVNSTKQQQPQIIHQRTVEVPQQGINKTDSAHMQQPLSIGQQSQPAQVIIPLNSQGQPNIGLSNSGQINCILQQPMNQVLQQPLNPVIMQPGNRVVIRQPLQHMQQPMQPGNRVVIRQPLQPVNQIIQQQLNPVVSQPMPQQALNQTVQQPFCQIVQQQPVIQVSQQSVNQGPHQSVGKILIPVSQAISQSGQIIPMFSPNTSQGLQQIQLPQQLQQMNQVINNRQKVLRVIQRSDGSLVLPKNATLQWSPQVTSQDGRVPETNQQNPSNQQVIISNRHQLNPTQPVSQRIVEVVGNRVPEGGIYVQDAPLQQNVRASEVAPGSNQTTQVGKLTIENTLSLDDFVDHLYES